MTPKVVRENCQNLIVKKLFSFSKSTVILFVLNSSYVTDARLRERL